ncbi:MAG TPA: hypothetical protein VHO03_16715 [Ignavibacteriales bacterium]|nr:hypothetical protein [Ignavibacteriales bacterium]
MKIGLYDVDGKKPNLALMKLSAYHKAKGDTTSFFSPLWRYDLIYASKVFTSSFEPDYMFSCEVIRGGSGYDLQSRLPDEVEYQYPDYDLYNCDYAMGFTTRGCIRKCPFCIVHEKEGKIREVGDIYSFWNGQKRLMLLDNNLTSLPEHFEKICKQLIKEKIEVDFSQGLDIRLIDEDKAKLLKKVKQWKRIHFAFDHVKLEGAVRRGMEILKKHIHPDRVMFYVLIGYDSTPEEDLYRVELLRSLGTKPFVMPYNRKDPYQRKFARYCNHKAIFNSVKWKDYRG